MLSTTREQNVNLTFRMHGENFRKIYFLRNTAQNYQRMLTDKVQYSVEKLKNVNNVVLFCNWIFENLYMI